MHGKVKIAQKALHGGFGMYRKESDQISIAEFYSPFGKLDPKNRWAKIADMIPWERYETKYAERFCEDNGAPAIRFRTAMGTLIIKQRTGHSDDEVLQDIMENPYMQYLIGLHEFTTEAPFAQSSITNFRKYITQEMINEINDDLFRKGRKGGSDNGNGNPGGSAGREESDETEAANRGTLMLDSTCAPAYITYPTDVSLLNEAREKLEGIIDRLHIHAPGTLKPRTYRQTARGRYLRFIRNRKPQIRMIRKAVGQQLRYVGRDLRHIDTQLQTISDEALTVYQRRWLPAIRKLYQQQKHMYESRTHSVESRIVSIGQPHVRPIVRGKANAAVEFGAKVSVSLTGGYAFVEKLSWEAFNEEATLIPAIETCRGRYGCYPEAVLADKVHRNRTNLSYCKRHGIRITGPRLGRPPKETDPSAIRQERYDAAQRNAIEGKFGEGKTKYGLDRIMARLMDSSETVIAMAFLCMNINRRLKVILCRFLHVFVRSFLWVRVKNLFAFGVIE